MKPLWLSFALIGIGFFKEFRLTGRDSLCPDGAAFVSTMPPSPSGGTAKG